MDHLEGIEAHGDTRGIEPGEDCSEKYQSESGEEDSDRPMKTDGPAKGLFVDHENENEGKEVAEKKTDEIGKETEKASLNENEFADLLSGRAEETEKSQFAATVDDQSKKSAGDTHDSDEDGDGFESVGDGEGAVENANGFGAQITIGKNEDVAVGSELLNGFADAVSIGRGT
jgi:hypothetical protein